jgi:hypothetical protein
VRDVTTRPAHPEREAPAEQEPARAATFSFATLDAAAMPRRSLSGKLIAATAALLLVAGGGAWTYLAMSNRTAAPASIGLVRDGATAAIAKATLKIDPEAITTRPKNTFAFNLILSGAPDIASAVMQIDYDPKLMQFVSAADGGLLAKGDEPALLAHRDDPIAGVLKISAQRPPGGLSASGDGTVLRLMFVARAKGSGRIAIAPSARDIQGRPIDVLAARAQVNITDVK